MLQARYDCKTAVIGSDIYVVGGYGDKETIYNVERYNNNKYLGFIKLNILMIWKTFVCVLSNITTLVNIIGGNKSYDILTCYCFVYNMNCNTWNTWTYLLISLAIRINYNFYLILEIELLSNKSCT